MKYNYNMISLENREKEVLAYRMSLVTIFSFLISVLLEETGTNIYVFGDGTFFTGYHIIAILVISLYGYLPAMVYLLMLFLYAAVNDFNTAYELFSLLMVMAVAYTGAKKRVYKSLKMSLGFAVLLAFAAGDIWLIILALCGDVFIGSINVYALFTAFAQVFPECLLSVILIYTFLNCVSDEVKSRTMTGYLYTESYQKNFVETGKNKPFVLGRRIIVALVLLTSAIVVFTIVFMRPGEIYTGDSVRGFFANEEYLKIVEYQYREAYNLVDDEYIGTIYFFFCMKRMLMLFTFMIPVIAISNFLISTYTLEPIKRLSGYIGAYSGASDEERYEMRYGENREMPVVKDEVYHLYAALYRLMEVVDRYGRKLKRDKRLKEELRMAQAQNRARNGFLSRMSHEIRTPINTILGMNEMILRESSDENIKGYAGDIQNAGKTLVSLINDVLDFSKIEMGTMEIIPLQYELGAMIGDLVNMISAKAESKKLKLIVDVNPDIPSLLFGDEIRIKQCCINILNNAVKYTEEGSVSFGVDWEKVDDNYIYLDFKVTDTGIGIKEEELEKLYRPFERIDEMNNRNVEGTGLGMSIVKNILSLMDSEVKVKSVYNEGSEFSFRILQEVIDGEKTVSSYKDNAVSSEKRKKYETLFHAPKAFILIVDDTPMNIEVIKGLIRDTRVNVYTAESGIEALKLMTRFKFDIVFMDHRMPGMDGIETLNASTVMPGNLNMETPFVALTANVVSGAREMFMQNGFVEYLSKPVDPSKLESTIIKLLPEDKVIFKGEPGFSDYAPGYEDDDLYDEHAFELLGSIDEKFVNIDEALKNCGSSEVLINVIKDFYASIDSKADLIENLQKAKEIREYTIQVHALKSSARLIGALELSEKAKYLEDCGNDGNIREVMVKTHELLVIYRAYKSVLKEVASYGEVAEEDAEMMGEEELKTVLGELYQMIEAFDFDTADSVAEMLKEYKYPENYFADIKKMLLYIKEVDRDKSLELIDKLLSR